MAKYECDECGNACYYDTLSRTSPSHCPEDIHRKPEWKCIEENLPDWCEEGVVLYDCVTCDYATITEVVGNTIYCKYKDSEERPLTSDYVNGNCKPSSPHWLKPNMWVYDAAEDTYAFTRGTNSEGVVCRYVDSDGTGDRIYVRSVPYVTKNMSPVECEPYGKEELISLVGKVLHRVYHSANGAEDVYRLVTGCENFIHQEYPDIYAVKLGDDFFEASDLLWWTCEGKPCCKFNRSEVKRV